jgi:hypothetical protein
MNLAHYQVDPISRVSTQSSGPLDAIIAEREALVEAAAQVVTRYKS